MRNQTFKIILHIDLNAFFASCEIRLRPDLEKKPVVISGPKSSKRGVVTTANYVARTYGVQSAMPLGQAQKKCPQLVVLPANIDLYRRVSKEFLALLGQYSPLIEPASIDEAYVDVTHHFPKVEPLALAQEIQNRIYQELKIGSSIGVAPNKFLAKMASDMKKPNGLTILRKRDIPQLLWPLSIEQMHGIGKVSAPKLKQLGIHTIGDLATTDKEQMIKQLLGPHALEWVDKANGEDNRPVDPDRYKKPSTIGHSTTFPKDYCFEEEIKTQLKKMCLKTANRLIYQRVYAKTITMQLKYFDFKQTSRSKSIEVPCQTTEMLYQVVEELFDEYWSGEPLRLVGVSTSNLVNNNKTLQQLNLFNYQSFETEAKIKQTVTQIKKKYGADSIQKGAKKDNDIK